MAQGRITTKNALLADIERSWTALQGALKRLTHAQLTVAEDPEGWTVKDHLLHLARWEMSVVCLLQGIPRHVGLGVNESLYYNGLDDAINAEIFRQTKGMGLDEAQTELAATHDQLLALLKGLSDEDLQKHYEDYLPDAPAVGIGRVALDMVYGNTAQHFDEHVKWFGSWVDVG